MQDFVTAYGGPIIVLLMVTFWVAIVIAWFRSPLFREGWRRRTLFDDPLGLNLLNENRWYLVLTVVSFGLTFLLLSLP